MKTNFYLVVNRNGAIKTYKNRPNLAWDEVSIFQTLTLPDALFKKPLLSAVVEIPESAAMPSAIDAEVIQNVQDAIETATGIQVRLEITNPEDGN